MFTTGTNSLDIMLPPLNHTYGLTTSSNHRFKYSHRSTCSFFRFTCMHELAITLKIPLLLLYKFISMKSVSFRELQLDIPKKLLLFLFLRKASATFFVILSFLSTVIILGLVLATIYNRSMHHINQVRAFHFIPLTHGG